MRKIILTILSVLLIIPALFFAVLGLDFVSDVYILGVDGVIIEEWFDEFEDMSKISLKKDKGNIYTRYVYVEDMTILEKTVSIYRDENGNIYTDEQKGELIDEIYTIMFTDAEGDKYISYMVVNIENAEFKTEFKPVLNGKPVKVSVVAKVGDFPSSEYSTLNYYETIYASVKKYVKSENAKETQDEKLTYICETKEQYDTYVQNFAQAELSNKKNVSVVCFVIAGIFMILFILVRRVKSNPEKATEEAKAPSRKKYGADANLDDAFDTEAVHVNGGSGERAGVYKEKPSAMETVGAKLEKFRGKRSVDKSRSSSGMEFEDEMRK